MENYRIVVECLRQNKDASYKMFVIWCRLKRIIIHDNVICEQVFNLVKNDFLIFDNKLKNIENIESMIKK